MAAECVVRANAAEAPSGSVLFPDLGDGSQKRCAPSRIDQKPLESRPFLTPVPSFAS